MRIVGLTGGIGSGKSTVTRQLLACGLMVIDCDAIAHAAVKKGTWGHRRVVRAFGARVLRADGELDREALGRLAFADRAARRKLNAATHTPVLLELLRRLLAAWLSFQWVVVVDMPLLVETGAYRFTSPVVVVAVSPEVQLARLVARDGAPAVDAAARIAAQAAPETRLRVADVVVSNDGTPEELEAQVARLAVRLRRGATLWGWLTSPLAAAAAAALILCACAARARAGV